MAVVAAAAAAPSAGAAGAVSGASTASGASASLSSSLSTQSAAGMKQMAQELGQTQQITDLSDYFNQGTRVNSCHMEGIETHQQQQEQQENTQEQFDPSKLWLPDDHGRLGIEALIKELQGDRPQVRFGEQEAQGERSALDRAKQESPANEPSPSTPVKPEASEPTPDQRSTLQEPDQSREREFRDATGSQSLAPKRRQEDYATQDHISQAGSSSHIPESDQSDRAEADDDPSMPPLLRERASAFLGGAASQGILAFSDLFELRMLFPTSQTDFVLNAVLEDLDDRYVKHVKQELKEFARTTYYEADQKDEDSAAAGGFFGTMLRIVSPSSRAKAGQRAGNALLGAAAARGGKKAIKKLKTKIKKALKKTKRGRMVKNVERTKAYRRLRRKTIFRNGKNKPLISKKKAPKGNQDAGHQKKVSGGKKEEYVGQLKQKMRNPKTKKGYYDTVQIDDLKVSKDGRLILVEGKYGKPGVPFEESGHVIDPISKANHLKRLVRFATENRKEVSHIEIWVNRTAKGESTVGEIYKEIVESLLPADRAKIIFRYI